MKNKLTLKCILTVAIALLIGATAMLFTGCNYIKDLFDTDTPKQENPAPPGPSVTYYSITFVADGEVVGTQKYKNASSIITEPPVPEKIGYVGNWEDYELNGGNKTVNALYRPITLAEEYSLAFDDDATKYLKMALVRYIDSGTYQNFVQNENIDLRYILAPTESYNVVNPDNLSEINWLQALQEAEVLYYDFTIEGDVENATYEIDGNDYVKHTNNLNMRKGREADGLFPAWYSLPYIVDNTGDTPVYTYLQNQSSMPFAKSAVELVCEELNASALGERSYSQEEINKMKSLINAAIDVVNGLDEIIEDGSMPMISFENGLEIVNGEIHQIEYSITPTDERMQWTVRYVSSDENIATVSQTGIVTGIAEGATTIKLYVAGELYTLNVTVANNA